LPALTPPADGGGKTLTPKPEKGGKTITPPPGKSGDETSRAQVLPATLVVELPAHATLAVDDQPTLSTSTSRVLESPPLVPGIVYHYTLKAEVVRDGRTLTQEKKVSVSAGQVTRVSFDTPETWAVARK
jgi:uncharacterized protein (TIGR03000 family)